MSPLCRGFMSELVKIAEYYSRYSGLHHDGPVEKITDYNSSRHTDHGIDTDVKGNYLGTGKEDRRYESYREHKNNRKKSRRMDVPASETHWDSVKSDPVEQNQVPYQVTNTSNPDKAY